MTYEPSGFALEIFHKRHALHPEETWKEGCSRVAHHVATAEGALFAKYRESFVDLLESNDFMPGGRIWYGSGRPKGQLLNCLSFSTEIITSRGIKKIGDLVGQVVTVLSEYGTWVDAPISSFGVQKLMKLTLKRGKQEKEIFATPEHGWFVRPDKPGVVPLQRLETQQLIPGKHKLQYVFGAGVKKYDPSPFGIAHGIVFGDGSTCHQSRRAANAIMLCDEKKELARFFPLSPQVPHPEVSSGGAIYVGGLPNHYRELPSIDENRAYLYGWLAGYFATDGCVDQYGRCSIASSVRANLLFVRDVCAVLGIGTYEIHEQVRTSNLNGKTSSVFNIQMMRSYLGDQFFLREKHQLRHVEHPEADIFHWSVVAVEEADREEEVFCATVPKYGKFALAGNILTANCFVVPTSDSREGWGTSTSDLMIISGTGGGVGFNFSPIRPRNSIIHGTGGIATGPVSLMRIKNAVGEELKAGGGRRVAMMHALGLTHPDLEEFLDAKIDHDELNNANVSIIFDDDPETFFASVRAGADFELRFGGKTHKKLSASEIWERIVGNALKDGEPGLLNGFLANRMNNVWYFAPLICTNPCGEIWLPPYDCCDLGALVLPRFIRGNGLDWARLKERIALAVRFLDNVLTVNQFPLAAIKEVCTNSRRIGLGVMGLSTMLLQLGYRYDSPAGVEFVDKLMNTIKNAAYGASIQLAIEKGPFPKFEADKFLRSGFVKTLKPSLRSKISERGMRNCALLCLAPTGTTAMICDVDGGIEPSHGPGHIRKFRDGDELKSEVVVHPLFRAMVEEGRDTNHFVSSYDLDLRAHFEMQRTCQRHIDNSVSKTINLLPGTSASQLSDLYMEFLPDLKGVTVYPEGSREDQPITPLSQAAVLEHLQKKLAVGHGPLSAEACKLGGECG